jgi:hypothetical protein
MRKRITVYPAVAAVILFASLFVAFSGGANAAVTAPSGGAAPASIQLHSDWHINALPAAWHGYAPRHFTAGAVCSDPSQFWNENSGDVMEVYHSETQNGANVDQWSNNGSNTQKWCLYSLAGSLPAFEVVNDNSGKCLDVTNDTAANGTNVQQWACLGNENQTWVQGGTGSGPGNNWLPGMDPDHGYNFVLEVYGSSTSDGGNVDIWTQNSSSTQYWCPVSCYG